MPYSGADVLAHLSELARQRAELPRVSCLLVMSYDRAEGDLIQSALRAVVGYETRILVVAALGEAVQYSKLYPPQASFCLDNAPAKKVDCEQSLRGLREAGITCPVAIIRGTVTTQIRCKLLDAGASDVLTRDEICGIRLRESLLRLLVPRIETETDREFEDAGRLTLVAKA
jgi:DNA-binding response OmpR family regulator